MTEDDLYMAAFECHNRKIFTPRNSRLRMMYRAYHNMKYANILKPKVKPITSLGLPKHRSVPESVYGKPVEKYMFSGIISDDKPAHLIDLVKLEDV